MLARLLTTLGVGFIVVVVQTPKVEAGVRYFLSAPQRPVFIPGYRAPAYRPPVFRAPVARAPRVFAPNVTSPPVAARRAPSVVQSRPSPPTVFTPSLGTKSTGNKPQDVASIRGFNTPSTSPSKSASSAALPNPGQWSTLAPTTFRAPAPATPPPTSTLGATPTSVVAPGQWNAVPPAIAPPPGQQLVATVTRIPSASAPLPPAPAFSSGSVTSPSSYTFMSMPNGTVQVVQNGKQVALTTPETAAIQYGYQLPTQYKPPAQPVTPNASRLVTTPSGAVVDAQTGALISGPPLAKSAATAPAQTVPQSSVPAGIAPRLAGSSPSVPSGTYVQIQTANGPAYFQQTPSGLITVTDASTLARLRSGVIPSTAQKHSTSANFASLATPSTSVSPPAAVPVSVSASPKAAASTILPAGSWSSQSASTHTPTVGPTSALPRGTGPPSIAAGNADVRPITSDIARDNLRYGVLARDAYATTASISAASPVAGFTRQSIVPGPHGFSATIYRNEIKNQYVIAYRGTDNLIGAADDVYARAWAPGMPLPPQYRQALAVAQDVHRSCPPPCSVILTGHSLGGGEASFVGSHFTNDKVVTFNAARNGLSTIPGNANQLNVVVSGDRVGDPRLSGLLGIESRLLGAGTLPGSTVTVETTQASLLLPNSRNGILRELPGIPGINPWSKGLPGGAYSHPIDGILGGIYDAEHAAP